MLESRKEMGAMRRGSVMMEFIIVFPIYLVLFAATFVLGDMLIHSNRLAFGDVMYAFLGDVAVRGDATAASGMEGYYRSHVLHLSDNGDQIRHVLPDLKCFQADEGGSWTECAASTFGITYRPTVGGALGQLLAAEALIGGTPHRADKERSAMDDWREGKFAGMKSKGGNILFESVFGDDNDLKSHSFYVLKRNRTGHYATGNWRWLTSGLLKNDRWLNEVLNDGWHTGATIQKMYTDSGRDEGKDISGYTRYDKFVDVSY